MRGCETLAGNEIRPGDSVVEAIDVMDKLWGYGGWEVTQTHDSLTVYLVEETYELLDAIAAGDPVEIREELGDLLLQVLFQSRIAQAAGHFDVDDVAATLVAKLAHRSPHLAEDAVGPIDIAEQEAAWERRKLAEKSRASCIDGIATSLPALALAEKVIGRARKAGLPAELVPEDLTTVRIGENGSAEVTLRRAVLAFADRIRAAERAAAAAGITPGPLAPEDWKAHWA
ncbi:MazG family protein [Rhodococcus sp. UNC363MFTsu5.1]|uniref:MazG family protein n=1 Tax=Rhodococcus sp. UNC363MFTsu5.1 TaxID=1449069 RepID=UPI001E38F12E|nr:MazG family protein [Rhodococcus sp. UNC363MFTsu5.1]